MIDENWTDEAINVLIILCKELGNYKLFRNTNQILNSLNLPRIDDQFTQKIANYCYIKHLGLYTTDDLLTSVEVIRYIHSMVIFHIDQIIVDVPDQKTVDGYPLSIMANVCQTNLNYAHIIGECVKNLTFDQVPDYLQMTIIGFGKLPLDDQELEAVHTYLDSRSLIYIHIFLNCLYELGKHNKFLEDSSVVEMEDLVNLLQSKWLFLLFTFRL